jgi:hypothetical protein
MLFTRENSTEHSTRLKKRKDHSKTISLPISLVGLCEPHPTADSPRRSCSVSGQNIVFFYCYRRSVDIMYSIRIPPLSYLQRMVVTVAAAQGEDNK